MIQTVSESSSRTTQKEATRQALKAAARQLFAAQGFSATQIGQITQAAGVAKGTFYVHFSDKDAVLEEMLDEFNEGFLAHIAPLLGEAPREDVPKLIEQLAVGFLEYWEANRAFIRFYSEKAAGGMSLDALQFGINPQMQSALRHLLTEISPAHPSDADIDLVIQGLLSMWLRLGLQSLFNPAATRTAVTKTLVAMTTGALAGALDIVE